MLYALPEDHDYPHVGATLEELPEGWEHDDADVLLGRGKTVWVRARQALVNWTQFDLGWVEAHDASVPLKVGQAFAFLSRQYGVWSVNACRVVQVVDDMDGQTCRFGLAYGTVGFHVVQGEEAFLLSWDQRTEEVRFRIRKFSRPAHPLVRLMRGPARAAQRRFTRDALARLAQEVSA